jgi:hypothetical protein
MEELLEPIRRLAPQPARTQRASSDGGDFVSFSTVATPLARAVEARQLALVELDNLVSAPDPAPAPAVQSPTFVLPERRRGRALPVALLFAATGVLLVIGTLIGVRVLSAGGSHDAAPAQASVLASTPTPPTPAPPLAPAGLAAATAGIVASTAPAARSSTSPPASEAAPKGPPPGPSVPVSPPRGGANRALRARQNSQDPLFSGDSPYGAAP